MMKAFEIYLCERNLSPNTTRSYLFALAQFNREFSRGTLKWEEAVS